MKITGGQTGVSGNVLICLLLLAQIEILLIFTVIRYKNMTYMNIQEKKMMMMEGHLFYFNV
nr:MAG TPA: hypothetical protein [Caudoviricetes sp.]